MNSSRLTEAIYRFVARLDDDPLIERRVREHAHLLRQEIESVHPGIASTLPKQYRPTPGFRGSRKAA